MNSIFLLFTEPGTESSFDDFMDNPFPESALAGSDESDMKSSASESETSTEEGTSSVTTVASSTSSSILNVDAVRLPVMFFPSFKVIGDNINKSVKPTEMTMDAQTQSLDYFNLYAVRDRVSMAGLDDSASLPSLSSCNVEDVLPTKQDFDGLYSNFAYLIARILKKHFPFFAEFAAGLQKHIKHEHYQEMSEKSNVVRNKSHTNNVMML